MKKFNFLFLFIFGLFLFKPFDTYAYTYVPEDIKITFWNSQNQTDSCEGLTQCYNFLPDKIANRVQTQSRKISFTEGRSYKMYISLKLSVPNEYYIYDFYLSDYNLRNYSINVDYNNMTFLYWDDFGWFNAYQWDLVLTVTPTFTSEGVSFDFYKNQAYNQAIWILDVLDFHTELLADSSDTGLIIDNNNKNTQDIIDNQKENTDKILDDDISDSENQANSFFDSFVDNDNGGISGIITAPLTAINSMLNGTCTPLTTNFKGKQISLSCGYDMWSKLSGIKDFLNLVLGGLLCYRICIKLFNLIQNLKNPDNDKVEVMNL